MRILFFRRTTMLLLLMAFVLLITGNVYSQTVPAGVTITYTGKRIPLKQVLQEIKKQTKYDVLFNPSHIDSTAIVTVNAKNQPLEEFLKAILSKQPLSYSFINYTIVVFRKEAGTGFTTPADIGLEIEGGVYEEKSGSPLAGVSVMLMRSGKGTQTDSRGQFMLKEVDENDSIRFTIIGYEPVTLRLKNAGKSLYVPMKIATSELDVLVVKAFGTTSNRLATGSITRISGEEIRRQPVMNPLLALQGRVPGMVVTPTSGHASAPVKVEIRGRNTLNENFSGEPLYVVDGVPRVILNVVALQNTNGATRGAEQAGSTNTEGQSILYGMNPADIESIEVLRDGDATALYGTRAANGVILITTKKAKAGKTSFSMNIDQGVLVNPFKMQMMNTQQYLEVRREAFKNDGITPTPENAADLLIWDTTRYTNWQEEILGTGKNTTVGAQLQGGDIRNSIYLSARYNSQTGMTQRSGKNETFGFNANLAHNSLNQKLSISLSAQYTWTLVSALSFGGNFTMAPNAPPIINEKGELNYLEWNAGTIYDRYPWPNILRPSTSKTNAFSSYLIIGYEMMKGLNFNTQLAYSNSQNSNLLLAPIASMKPSPYNTGQSTFGNSNGINWSVRSTLNYSTWIGRGNLAVTAGVSYENQLTKGVSSYGFGYDNDELLGSINNAPGKFARDAEGLYKIASVFGTINYNWENKYIINLNGRRDGSSRFAPDRQFGDFGSVGASWILSEENWMKKWMPSWLSFVKLRTSYALTGSDGIGDYQYLSLWGGLDAASGMPKYSYNGVMAFAPLNPVNQQYRWEANKKWDGAIRVGFLNERINIELITYRNITDNALVPAFPTPVYSGFPSVVTNSNAKVENKGVEFTLSANLVRQKNFSWSIGFNVGANKNKLLAYPGLESSPHAKIYRIGQSTTSEILLHYLGVDPLTGAHSFEDYNKDGRIMIDHTNGPGKNGDDRYIYLDVNPKFDGGFNTAFTFFKDFSVNMVFIFRKGLTPDLLAQEEIGGMRNYYMPETLMNNHWRKPGDKARYARFTTSRTGSALLWSDGRFIDGTYLRLNNISFSWQLPQRFISKAALNNCVFSLSVNNVFVISRYKGVDPTLGTTTSPPYPRIINARLSFTF